MRTTCGAYIRCHIHARGGKLQCWKKTLRRYW
nr:MAG TPA: hypothetical protein [Caudoviricetes sp.]